MFRKQIIKLLIQMIEDFKEEKKEEGKTPTLKLMLEELKLKTK